MEKVLSPPQKPMRINNLIVFEELEESKKTFVKAKIKQATTFETNVASGSWIINFWKNKPIAKRTTEPNPPPRKTNKKFTLGK